MGWNRQGNKLILKGIFGRRFSYWVRMCSCADMQANTVNWLFKFLTTKINRPLCPSTPPFPRPNQSLLPPPSPLASPPATSLLLEILNRLILQQKNLMDEVGEQEQGVEVAMRRPFAAKFFKQLNYHQNQKVKRSKRRLKTGQSPQKAQILQRVGVRQSSKRLQEVNRNGNRILANWKNDQINGQAEIYYHNGVTFKGLYQNGVKVKGHFKFLNGYEYIGQCLGNKFFGEGSLIFPSGKVISGEWKEYNIVGNGKMEYPHGEVYYGEIVDFKKHGKGYLFLSDGSKYVGEFTNGLISGNGTYYVDDVAVSKGYWENGELVRPVELEEVNEESIELVETDHRADEIEREVRGRAEVREGRQGMEGTCGKKVHFVV